MKKSNLAHLKQTPQWRFQSLVNALHGNKQLQYHDLLADNIANEPIHINSLETVIELIAEYIVRRNIRSEPNEHQIIIDCKLSDGSWINAMIYFIRDEERGWLLSDIRMQIDLDDDAGDEVQSECIPHKSIFGASGTPSEHVLRFLADVKEAIEIREADDPTTDLDHSDNALPVFDAFAMTMPDIQIVSEEYCGCGNHCTLKVRTIGAPEWKDVTFEMQRQIWKWNVDDIVVPVQSPTSGEIYHVSLSDTVDEE